MSTVIGRQFCHTQHGVTALRKVIDQFYEGPIRAYRLLNLVTKEKTVAIADIFDRTFKNRRSGPINLDKKAKGKTIRGKQMKGVFED